MSGTVLLRLNIDAQGRVTAVAISRSSGHALLDRAAVDAVRQWRGRPAEQDGVPIETTALLPVKFELSQ
jgi:protein TonB